MKLKSPYVALAATAGLAVAAVATTVVVAAPERPAALQALEKQGVTIVGTFPAPGGLRAWAGYINQRPVSMFVTPDGKHVILTPTSAGKAAALLADRDPAAALAASLGLPATPAMVWRDPNGGVQVRTGAPDSVLPTVPGPR